jgi:hypothetical protein
MLDAMGRVPKLDRECVCGRIHLVRLAESRFDTLQPASEDRSEQGIELFDHLMCKIAQSGGSGVSLPARSAFLLNPAPTSTAAPRAVPSCQRARASCSRVFLRGEPPGPDRAYTLSRWLRCRLRSGDGWGG